MKSHPNILSALLASSLAISTASAATIQLNLTTTNPGGFTLPSGNNDFTFGSFSVDYLIVGGGGGGGSTSGNTSRRGGGGGAGGLLQGTGLSISGAQTITVGAGGTGGVQNGVRGVNGGDSSAFSLTAIGGGGGASAFNQAGGNGGSGGGGYGATNALAAGTGVVGQGNNGAPIPTINFAGSGGGGAGGTSAINSSVGGAGLSSSITGSSVTYAEGGDAGGGSTGQVSATPAPATANTGNGGNGITPNRTTTTPTPINGQAGGSGIVVVSYSGSQVLAGGIVSTVGGKTVHQFTSTGASTLDLHSATIAGGINGSGNLVWNKAGILTIGGANTYTGATTINLGQLFLAGAIGSTSDLIFLAGGKLDLGTTGLIRILQSNYSISDANNDISNNSIFAGDNLQVSTFNDGFNNFTQITVIPEPSAALLGSLGLLALLRRRRK
jgi:hypothetical protein